MNRNIHASDIFLNKLMHSESERKFLLIKEIKNLKRSNRVLLEENKRLMQKIVSMEAGNRGEVN
ncbi:MAG: hypothetical protein CMI54_04720 [Parcubacteria group bacterium]|nr:hypothetical protein [Parcubacteria group bacterium]